jgi:phage terminase large subunit-like protein
LDNPTDQPSASLAPFLVRSTSDNLQEEGVSVFEVRLGTLTPALAVDEFEHVIPCPIKTFDGNPDFRWTVSNLVMQTDKAENNMLSKGKARERIDAAAAFRDDSGG